MNFNFKDILKQELGVLFDSPNDQADASPKHNSKKKCAPMPPVKQEKHEQKFQPVKTQDQASLRGNSEKFLQRANLIISEADDLGRVLQRINASVQQAIDAVKQKTKIIVKGLESKLEGMVKGESNQSENARVRDIEGYVIRNQNQLEDLSSQMNSYKAKLSQIEDFKASFGRGRKQIDSKAQRQVQFNDGNLQFQAQCKVQVINSEIQNEVKKCKLIGEEIMAVQTENGIAYICKFNKQSLQVLFRTNEFDAPMVAFRDKIIIDKHVYAEQLNGEYTKSEQLTHSDVFLRHCAIGENLISATRTFTRFELRSLNQLSTPKPYRNTLKIVSSGSKDHYITMIKPAYNDQEQFICSVFQKSQHVIMKAPIKHCARSDEGVKKHESELLFRSNQEILDFHQPDDIHIIILTTSNISIIDQFSAHVLSEIPQRNSLNALHLVNEFDIHEVPLGVTAEGGEVKFYSVTPGSLQVEHNGCQGIQAIVGRGEQGMIVVDRQGQIRLLKVVVYL
ncbi:hypothetical protein FGO68_gene11418 [Halteria grandinella]|uniref:Uncharacterized protein n=1 Tax=Halteria grandinella TaxID=5974 RepID=A0A8J8P7Q1_HALGN|nr:hypothetical protein FGO68_gene11418 [Halteria grandinella]